MEQVQKRQYSRIHNMFDTNIKLHRYGVENFPRKIHGQIKLGQ